MTKRPKKPKRPIKKPASDHVIPPAIPIDALSSLVFERDGKSVEEIAAYVVAQSPGETVAHAEKVMTQRVLGRKYDCWDVRTDKTRLWVITSPTHLYNQALFPSLDYTLSFHIGLMARVGALTLAGMSGAGIFTNVPVDKIKYRDHASNVRS